MSLSNPYEGVQFEFFPTSVGETVRRFKLDDLLAFSTFSNAFVPIVLQSGRIYASYEGDVVEVANHPLAQHLDRVLKCVTRRAPAPFPRRISWRDVRNRYSRPVNRSKNVDVRMAFRRDNDYLVKSWFTFGQRTVARGQAHVYQTANAPLLVYKSLRPSIRLDRCLIAGCPYDYEAFVLEPDSAYAFGAGDTYTLLAFQKTAFRLDVVSACSLERVEFPVRNPFHRRLSSLQKQPDRHERSCETPTLEEMGSRKFAAALPEPRTPVFLQRFETPGSLDSSRFLPDASGGLAMFLQPPFGLMPDAFRLDFQACDSPLDESSVVPFDGTCLVSSCGGAPEASTTTAYRRPWEDESSSSPSDPLAVKREPEEDERGATTPPEKVTNGETEMDLTFLDDDAWMKDCLTGFERTTGFDDVWSFNTKEEIDS